jgi:8-oxo-dGTP diphosphatase
MPAALAAERLVRKSRRLWMSASHAYPEFHLLTPLFVCRVWHGLPQPREGQALRWLRPRDMVDLPMPPADRPLVAFLRDYL